MGTGSVFGLAYDPNTNRLIGTQSTIAQGVFDINRATGAASQLGGNPGVSLDGITYVGSNSRIEGIFAGPGSIHSVDSNTGAVAQVNPGSGFVNNCGVAWDPNTNMMYAVDWSGSLLRYDVGNSYSQTFVAGLGRPFDGIAYAGVVPEPASMIALSAGILALVRKRRK